MPAAAAAASGQLGPGKDEPPRIACDGLAEPLRPRLGADEDEQGVHRDAPPRPGGGVLQHQRFEIAASGAVGDLHAVADVDVRGRTDLADEVVGHAVGQRSLTHQDGHPAGPFGQVQCGLPGGVAATGDKYVPPAHGRRLAGRGAVKDAPALQVLQGWDAQSAVGGAGRDDHCACSQNAAIGQPQPVVAVVSGQALHLAHEQEPGAEGPRLPPGLLRQSGTGDALSEAGVVTDHRTGPGLPADGLMLDHHGRKALRRCTDRGSQPGGPSADHRHIEDFPRWNRRHDAESVGDLQVGGVGQRWLLRGEPEHDHRQFRRLQAKLVQDLPGVPTADVVKTDRDLVAGKQVTQLLRSRGPSLADHLHRLEAAAALAVPLPQELRDQAVELLGRGLHRAVRPVVEGAQGDRVEDRPRRLPVTPAHHGHPQCRGVDGPDRGKHRDAIAVLAADPADDQRHRQARGAQVPHPGCQLRGLVAGGDLIVPAIPLGQLPVQGLPDATVTADDDDDRLCLFRFTAPGGVQFLRRSGSSAS